VLAFCCLSPFRKTLRLFAKLNRISFVCYTNPGQASVPRLGTESKNGQRDELFNLGIVSIRSKIHPKIFGRRPRARARSQSVLLATVWFDLFGAMLVRLGGASTVHGSQHGSGPGVLARQGPTPHVRAIKFPAFASHKRLKIFIANALQFPRR